MPSANASDFFGEGTFGSQTAGRTRDWSANPPRSMAEWDMMVRETGSTATAPAHLQPEQAYVAGYAGGRRNDNQAVTYTGTPADWAATVGREGYGATSGYQHGNAATRAAYDQYHRDNKGSDPFNPFGLIYDALALPTAPIGYLAQKYNESTGNPGATPTATDTGPVIGGGDVPTFVPPEVPGGTAPPGGTGTTPPPTGEGAPAIPRENIDPLLDSLRGYEADMYAMSQDNTGLSAAEAQLRKATELANINAAIQSDQSQRAALGAARSARNRGDRAILEQAAIGEAGFIGQEAARTAALRQAEQEGNLAELRANEENADREFKLKALQAARDAGLNTAALELDIAKADLGSASNLLNQQFGLMGIQKQVDQAAAAAALNFAKDMATIQFQYDKLSVDDQNEADRLLMEKYRIDQDTMVALKKIKEENGFDWTALVSGFMTGTLPVVAGKVLDEAFED